MSKTILCIDTELSCWEDSAFQRQQVMEIFEFGMAEIDVETLTISRSGRYFVKNTRHEVTPFCTNLTGITQRILDKQGLPLEHVSQLLSERWGVGNKMKPLVAWGDESKWMRRDFDAKGINYPFHNSLINLAHYYRFGFLTGKNAKSSMKKACARYNVPVTQPQHSAVSDAITLANLTIAMIKHGHIWPAFVDKKKGL